MKKVYSRYNEKHKTFCGIRVKYSIRLYSSSRELRESSFNINSTTSEHLSPGDQTIYEHLVLDFNEGGIRI